jgi:hypothetical protein
MEDAKTVRLCALAGLVFVVLIVVAGPVLQSGSPSLTDSSAKMYHFMATHVGKLKASGALSGFAVAAVLVWLAAHFSALRKAEGGHAGFAPAALAGGILAAASTVVGGAVLGVAALRIHDLTAVEARFFWTLQQFMSGGILAGLTILVGASAVVFLNTGIYGRWFTWVSAALAVLDLVGILGLVYANGAIQTIVGIGLSLTILWILVVSVMLWRKPELAII